MHEGREREEEGWSCIISVEGVGWEGRGERKGREGYQIGEGLEERGVKWIERQICRWRIGSAQETEGREDDHVESNAQRQRK